VACDIAINQRIPGIVEAFANHAAKPLMPMKDQELNREAEYYFTDLVNQLKNDPDFLKGVGTLDDHGNWDISDLSAEAQKEILTQATKQAKAAAGTVSGELSALLDKLHHKPLNWKALLRRFVANAENVYKNKTVMRANRRFGFSMPGTIKKRKIKLAVAVDTSGSVSDAALATFFTEIDHITKSNADVILIQADCEVKSVKEYKTGKWPKITGRGGTAYDPALKAAVKEGVDGIIYFGDMDTADVPDKPRTAPVMWVSCGSDRRPGEFGQMVMIKAGE
jgi:predicted metal-dependent peptidase